MRSSIFINHWIREKSLSAGLSPRADVVAADTLAVRSVPSDAAPAPTAGALALKSNFAGGKALAMAAQLRTYEEAAARQDARTAAGLPPHGGVGAPAGAVGPLGSLRCNRLAAFSPAASPVQGSNATAIAGLGAAGIGGARRDTPARPLRVSFAPGTPPSGVGTALGAHGVWSTHVGTAPRCGLLAPPVFNCTARSLPTLATLVVPVRTDASAGLVLKPAGDALFGDACADEPSRDAAVASSGPLIAKLLGEEAEFTAYLAGEWVDSNLRWRVVLCVLGGPLRSDMAIALRNGSAACSTCRWAYWWRAASLSSSRAADIARAALARARSAMRPAAAGDSRLRFGRGDEQWVDPSQDAVSDVRTLLDELALPGGEVLVTNRSGGDASGAAPAAGCTPDRGVASGAGRDTGAGVEGGRAGVVERMAQAHAEVQQLLYKEAASHRRGGDEALAAFLEGCASRVEPAPLLEVPEGLAAAALSDQDMHELTTRPFVRKTVVTETAAPVYRSRPTGFPAHLPTPTSHASFLQDDVMNTCLDWYESADEWHATRVAGVEAPRPTGIAYGFDAVRPEWRPFFEAGGVVIFDQHTGAPTCLTLENYPLCNSLNGDFARREFADYPDQEMVAAIADGVTIKAQGLPFLQLACNLKALYTADGVAGVRSVAVELDKFGTYDETGWLLRAPKADRARGLLSTATLPSCSTPIGAVPKKDGGTRVVTDMTYPYGKLKLSSVESFPLPPDHRWDGESPYRPAGPRPHESAVTLGGGGATVLPPNVASGPSKPPKGEHYVPNGTWPWPHEGKSTVREHAVNDVILSVPCQRAGLPVYHLAWDFWKCFHQTSYRPFEVIATAALVPYLDGAGELAKDLRGVTNGRMAMGGLFASGICQRGGNGTYCKTMQRFDARQKARRLLEPESPAVARWLDAREALQHDAYGTQARLACGGFYSDDPKFSCAGPPSRVLDLALSFYEVVGPEGLGFKFAEHTKWQVACWASWQGVRMSAMLGLLWLPPDKSLRADEDLRAYGTGSMVGADFVKMMGFLNYLAEVLAVHAYLNQALWESYDALKLGCHEADLGATVVVPAAQQQRAVTAWRKIIMRTPGTTLLRIVRRAPPPRDNVMIWALASDACMDVIKVDGVKVAGCLHRGVDHDGRPMHDPPGMGGVLHGRLWQYCFSAAEIEVVTIPVAEFMAAVVGLFVYDSAGILEYAERVRLEVDAEATPRSALQGEAHRPGLLIAHEEFALTSLYAKYRPRLTTQHVFGAGNEGADKASRSRNAEAERLVRFLGLEPRWLPVPQEALSYITAVIERLRKQPKAKPGTCDPAVPGGDAPRFGSPASPSIVWRRFASTHSPPSAPVAAPSPPPGTASQRGAALQPNDSPRVAPAFGARLSYGAQSAERAGASALGAPPSPALLVSRRPAGAPYLVPDDAESPPALSARPPAALDDGSPRVARAVFRADSPSDAQGVGRAGAAPLVSVHALVVAAEAPGVVALAPELAVEALGERGERHVSQMIAQRVDALMAINQNSTRAHAFRGDPDHLRALLDSSQRAQAQAANENSVAAEEAHMRLYWKPYCDLQRTPTLRPDERSLTWDEIQLEEAWWAGCIPFIQKLMPNQQGVVGAAKPESILKVPINIRRSHIRQGIRTVSLASCVRATEGLLRAFLLEHGPLALIPKRKEPLTNEEIRGIFAFSGRIGGPRSRRCLDWDSPEYSSLLAMFHTLAQTGMRKGEVSLPKNARFDKSRLSMLNVRWCIGGVVCNELTPELYQRLLKDGGFALLRPPPSKADPFSLHWGPCTIYLRFHPTEAINAARELAREELRRKVPLADRETAPLFVKADGTAWRHTELAKVFDEIVTEVCGAARAKQLSMHSWRVYLACALLSKGASFATIQTMLRWKSEDALRIYARINNFAYADWLSAAQGASVSSVRTTTGVVGALSAPPEPGTLAGTMLEAASEARAMQEASDGPLGTPVAGFQHEWMRRAAQAVGDAVRDAHAREALPEIDAYERVSTLSSSMPSLILAAQRADVEDSL